MQTTKSTDDLVKAAKGHAGTIDADEVRSLHEDGALLLDVRGDGEWEQGHVEGAEHLTRGMLEFKIDDVESDKNRRIVTYCASGGRAALAASRLKDMGYAGAIASTDGYDDLKKAGLPVAN